MDSVQAQRIRSMLDKGATEGRRLGVPAHFFEKQQYIEGDTFAPVKRVEKTEKVVDKREVTTVDYVRTEHTKWFDAATVMPGQNGVYELDPVKTDDLGNEARRFAYHNGREFGPAAPNPQAAYNVRLNGTASSVSKFRGLKEQA